MTASNNIDSIRQVRAVSVTVKEWFDRANGNSYFSGLVTLNPGTETEETLKLQYQYGYGNSSEHAAMEAIKARFPRCKWDNRALWQLRERQIPYSYEKHEGCTKKEMQAFAS